MTSAAGWRCMTCDTFVPLGVSHGCNPYPSKTASPHPWGPPGIPNPLRAVVDALVVNNDTLMAQNTSLVAELDATREARDAYIAQNQRVLARLALAEAVVEAALKYDHFLLDHGYCRYCDSDAPHHYPDCFGDVAEALDPFRQPNPLIPTPGADITGDPGVLEKDLGDG